MSDRLTVSQVLAFRTELETLKRQLHLDAAEQGVANIAAQQACVSALERIDDGEYGVCLSCGEDIELNCLRADPLASYCLSCLSKQGVVKK